MNSIVRAIPFAALLLLTAPLRAADGDLDESFWSTGKVYFSGSGTYEVNAVVAAPDGRVVVAGTHDPTAGARRWFWRAIGADSASTTAFCYFSPSEGATSGHANAAIFDNYERLYLAGAGYHSGDQLAVARFNYPDCDVDASFHANGYWTADIPGGVEAVTAIALDPEGAFALGGYQSVAGETDWLIARMGLGGGFYIGFSDDGWLTVDVSGSSEDDGWVSGIAFADGHSIVAAGSTHQNHAYNDWHVLQFTPSGTPDSDFAGDGHQRIAFDLLASNSGDDKLFGLARDPSSGKIVVSGTAETPTGKALAIARLLESGPLDVSFSGDGKTTLAFGDAEARAEAVVVDGLGRVLVGGFLAYPDDDADFIALRYREDGILDSTFGFGGLSLIAFNAGPDVHDDDVGHALALQPGYLVVAGDVEVNASSEARAGVARVGSALLFADSFESGWIRLWSGSSLDL